MVVSIISSATFGPVCSSGGPSHLERAKRHTDDPRILEAVTAATAEHRMRITTSVSLWIVRLAGVVQLVLGILIWIGRGSALVPLHMVAGSLLVLALWTIAALALALRVHRGLAVFVLLWGLALPAFGAQQAAILIGSMHWIIRVIHLLMGAIAIGLAVMLGRATLAATSIGARP
jgi:hypothetical protein